MQVPSIVDSLCLKSHLQGGRTTSKKSSIHINVSRIGFIRCGITQIGILILEDWKKDSDLFLPSPFDHRFLQVRHPRMRASGPVDNIPRVTNQIILLV